MNRLSTGVKIKSPSLVRYQQIANLIGIMLVIAYLQYVRKQQRILYEICDENNFTASDYGVYISGLTDKKKYEIEDENEDETNNDKKNPKNTAKKEDNIDSNSAKTG